MTTNSKETANGKEANDRACSTGPEIVPIKRYPNRRFYDRKSSKYVTLQEIEELVRGGRTIEVRDSRNDEDLTRVVLAQILLERQPERMEMFPIPLLHIMLRANDLSLEFLRVFMKLSLATLESLQGSRTLSPFVSPFDWMRMFFPGFAPLSGPRKSDEPRETPIEPREIPIEPRVVTKEPRVVTNEPPEGTIEQLSRRVAELEGRLRQLESETPAATNPGKLPGQPQRQVRGLEDRSSK
jgi:polyhydroxyalkanoate synthesis repressor PhaR